MSPTSFATDFKRINYTDGSYVEVSEESGRKVFYPPSPKKGVNNTYEIATAVLSIENTASGSQRVVYVNGTIVIYSPDTGNYSYEVEPTQYFEAIVTEWISDCQYVVYNFIFDTKTINFCPIPLNSSEKTVAISVIQETTFRDNSTRCSYVNGTIARFSPNKTFLFYEVPPKTLYLEFAITRATDGSITIDYSAANKTKRFIPAPLSASATPRAIAIALKYKDIYQNGTQRAFYFNGTIAILNAQNGLVRYEQPPEWLFGGCRPGEFYDGRNMMNCSDVNGTLQVFFPPQTLRNTAYENATAPIKDEIQKDGFFIRYYRNGTQVKYNSAGGIEAVLIPPTSMAQPPADFTVNET